MEHSHKPVNSTKSQNEKKTAFVVLFSAATMVLEIIFGRSEERRVGKEC